MAQNLHPAILVGSSGRAEVLPYRGGEDGALVQARLCGLVRRARPIIDLVTVSSTGTR